MSLVDQWVGLGQTVIYGCVASNCMSKSNVQIMDKLGWVMSCKFSVGLVLLDVQNGNLGWVIKTGPASKSVLDR